MGVFLTSSSPSFFNILTEAEGFRDDDVDEGALLVVVVAVVVASTVVVVVSGTSFCSILHSLVEFQSSSLLGSRLKLLLWTSICIISLVLVLLVGECRAAAP